MKHYDFVRPLLWMLLILQTYSYAPTPWRTVSIYTPTSQIYQDSVFDQYLGGSYLYFAVLLGGPPVDTIELKQYVPNTDFVAVTANFYAGSLLTQDVKLINLNNHLLVTYEEAGIQYLRRLQKSDLSTVSTLVVSQKPSGIYLENKDLFVYREVNEELIVNIETTPNTIATFVTPTALPQQIKYLYNEDETKLYTFYQDLSYFLVRTFTTPAEFAMNFNSPVQVNMGSVGYQCVCYSNNLKLVFILSQTGILMYYNQYFNKLVTVKATSYSGMTDCMHETWENGIIFFSSTTSTKIYLFLLSDYSEGTLYTYPGTNIGMDDYFHYFFLDSPSSGNAELFYVGFNTMCATTYYWDDTGNTCQACLSSCTTCFNNILCVGCPTGKEIDTTGLCVDPVVQTPEQYQFFQEAVDELIENIFIRTVNKIPGGRKMLPFLCFLINIDELQLYMFHERTYGTRMENFFRKLQEFQDEKWELVGSVTTDVLYDQVGTSRDQILEALDTKANYTFPRFRSMEGRGDTFLPACWEFLTFNLLFVLVSFCLLRWGFRKMRKDKISLLLRPFSSLVFLSPMLLDGNLQYFCFLLFTQVQRGFSLNPRDRALTALNYIIYFFVIWFAVVSCFLSYYLAKRLTQYILDNWRTRVKGLLTYSLSNAFRMLVFGGLHSLLRSHPAQLPLLMGAEVIYIVLMLFPMRYWRIHEVAYKVWFAILFAALRICLQISFLSIQAQGVLSSQMDSKYVDLHNYLLFTYLGGIYFATGWEVIYEVVDLATPAKTNDEESNQKKSQKQKIKKGEKDGKKVKTQINQKRGQKEVQKELNQRNSKEGSKTTKRSKKKRADKSEANKKSEDKKHREKTDKSEKKKKSEDKKHREKAEKSETKKKSEDKKHREKAEKSEKKKKSEDKKSREKGGKEDEKILQINEVQKEERHEKKRRRKPESEDRREKPFKQKKDQSLQQGRAHNSPKVEKRAQTKDSLISRMIESGKNYNTIKIFKIKGDRKFQDKHLWIVGQRKPQE